MSPATGRPSFPARLLLSLTLWLYPRAIRSRFGAEMRQFVVDEFRDLGKSRSARARLRFYLRTFGRLAGNGIAARWESRRNRRGPALSAAAAVSAGLVGDRRPSKDRPPTDLCAIDRPKMAMGPPARARERLGALGRALLHSIRSLARAPGFSLTSVLTLGLAIGACTLIFSVVYPVLVAQLPYEQSERLAVLFERSPGPDGIRGWVSPLTFRDWQDRSDHFARLTSYRLQTTTWTGDDDPAMLSGWAVSAGFFPLMGVEMTLGRGFTEAEDRPGGERVVVISSGFWNQHYGADPDVLGKTMTLDGAPYTIVGVASPSLEFPSDGDFWVPAAIEYGRGFRDFRYLGVIGRLREGSSLDRAREEMARIAAQIEAENRETNAGWGAELESLKEFRVGYVRPYLVGMSVAVGILLLIALGNTVNLFIVRNTGRQAEAAVRRALGAGRGALARLFVTEAMLLALVGGGLGAVIAVGGAAALNATALIRLPRLQVVTVNAEYLGFGVVVTVVVGLVLGVLSVLISGGQNLSQSLRGGGAGRTASARAHRARELVLATQVALALSLVIGATLLARSLLNLADIDVGFSPGGLYSFSFDLPGVSYSDPAVVGEFYRETLLQIGGIPGVEASGAVTPMPMEMGSVPSSWSLSARVREPGDQVVMAHMRTVTPGYFKTMGIPLLAGRLIDDTDDAAGKQVALVNLTFAERYLTGHDPVGVRISPDDPNADESDWITIVGVVGDVRFRSLTSEGEPEIYIPKQQFPSPWGHLVVRASGSPEQITGAVSAAVHRVDPDLPIGDIKTGKQIIGGQLRTSRLYTTLTALFASTATALAVVGIVGVLSIVVAQRTREIGLRIVLGARSRSVWGFVVSRGMRPVAVGLVLGMGGAIAGTRYLESQVYGVDTLDPLAFVLPTVGFAAAGLLACVVPGVRAASTDPVELLSSE